MPTKCRFPSCEWTGDIDDLFGHCETYHSKYLREINAKNSFSFSFEEMFNDTFLLTGKAGLYWFLLDPKDDPEAISRGIFAIGDSDKTEYTVKIGRINDCYCTYMGPYDTQPDTSDFYELKWCYVHLEILHRETLTKCMELFFGEYEDDEEYKGTYHDVDWSDPEEEKYNQWCLEKFTCFVCFEYIRQQARFCENRHFLCSDCLAKLVEQKKAKCPMCRADFPYDCMDPEIEDLLKCVRFPDVSS